MADIREDLIENIDRKRDSVRSGDSVPREADTVDGAKEQADMCCLRKPHHEDANPHLRALAFHSLCFCPSTWPNLSIAQCSSCDALITFSLSHCC
jgi:hypothetical protein